MISLFPDFTQQVQEAGRQFLLDKQKLRDLKLDYNMLYLAWLCIMVGGKALSSTDPKKLQQFITKKEAKGQQGNAQAAGSGDAAEQMDDEE
ncbi:hypothetical protein NDU88_003414 [Pleurodeles waltl]|uniref:Uncharacterized protein n=1 Tax=Pleurodeles waltl TaxID=8319 RepID=A0AAV7VDA7_PLEWA|nr:hypothetical protein NDU88_003414 [Pleurodeles waltl]